MRMGIRNRRTCMWEIACGVPGKPDISSRGIPLGFHSIRLADFSAGVYESYRLVGSRYFVASFNLSPFPVSCKPRNWHGAHGKSVCQSNRYRWTISSEGPLFQGGRVAIFRLTLTVCTSALETMAFFLSPYPPAAFVISLCCGRSTRNYLLRSCHLGSSMSDWPMFSFILGDLRIENGDQNNSPRKCTP